VTHDQEEAMTMSDRIAVMNKGKYEQLGDPEALYERPKTRFVAGFLGVSNLLPATRDGADNGYAGFRLADGSAVRLPSALVEGRGAKVAIGIRPEKFRMIEPKKDIAAGLNRAPGVVTHASYLGVSNLLPAKRDGADNGYAGFRLADGSAVRVPAALVEGRGDAVALGVRPEKFRMIEPAKDVPAGLNRAPGVVSHASYLGVSTQYIVTLADGHRVTVFEQNVERATKAELWTAGEQVVLAWSPDHCFVVEDDGGVGGNEDGADRHAGDPHALDPHANDPDS
jgi:ABC-type Fe3+/spermidine/putrescine transport system ATPase subunit